VESSKKAIRHRSRWLIGTTKAGFDAAVITQAEIISKHRKRT